MKKILCLMLVLAMCVAMAVPALASDFVPSVDYDDAPDGDGTGSGTGADGAPETGDFMAKNMGLWIVVMAAAAVALVAVVANRRKIFG